jgi:hypothetical protein
MTSIAPVKWAQRVDSLYVTITLPDVKDHKIDLTETKLVFSGKSLGKDYALDLEFVSSISYIYIFIDPNLNICLIFSRLDSFTCGISLRRSKRKDQSGMF